MSARVAPFALLLLSALSVSVLAQEPASTLNQIESHERLARQYLSERKPELAIPELEKVVALDPGNVDASANLGVLLFFHGDYKAAIPHLQIALKLQPGLSKVQALLGFAEEHISDLPDARTDLEACFPVIDDKKLKLEVGLDLLGLYNASSDLDAAAVMVAQLRKAFPDNPEVLYAAYRTYGDLSGESMLALSLVAPDSAQMHQLLAHEEIRDGNTNAAIAEYRKAIALDLRLPGVHFELAELLHTSQDPAIRKEAVEQYHASLAQNPQDEKALCRLADIAAQNGDLKQEFADYSKAVALQPADAAAKLGLAKALIEMDQDDKALPLLQSSEQLEPTDAVVHYRLATLYRKMGRTADARREVDLYKQYKDMKDKLRALYKGLLIQPQEIRLDQDPDNDPDNSPAKNPAPNPQGTNEK
ncbi:MAG TPA: tetratricopeptide repeat protein [Terracidiphilus sp.]|jgi:tetratricopeptide (TPR) repeat protein|nr:tetratricopeptide repeat protein [Terracidiphilus sp.]